MPPEVMAPERSDAMDFLARLSRYSQPAEFSEEVIELFRGNLLSAEALNRYDVRVKIGVSPGCVVGIEGNTLELTGGRLELKNPNQRLLFHAWMIFRGRPMSLPEIRQLGLRDLPNPVKAGRFIATFRWLLNHYAHRELICRRMNKEGRWNYQVGPLVAFEERSLEVAPQPALLEPVRKLGAAAARPAVTLESEQPLVALLPPQSTPSAPSITPTPADQPDELDRLALALLNQPKQRHWQHQALCAQVDSELFFDDFGKDTVKAKRVCQNCPVRIECLDNSIKQKDRYGIFGGLSAQERSAVRKRARELDSQTPQAEASPPSPEQ